MAADLYEGISQPAKSACRPSLRRAALEVSERLRAGIAANPLRLDAERIGISISVGLAITGDADDSIEQVIGRADALLYQAKERGRNRVCHQEPLLPA
ncbi:MAG TPA: diguanylate cyclase [Acetobacteraceae bacterium]|nr:diguanylate cyclase [Acetobacteraceae bacterium]